MACKDLFSNEDLGKRSQKAPALMSEMKGSAIFTIICVSRLVFFSCCFSGFSLLLYYFSSFSCFFVLVLLFLLLVLLWCMFSLLSILFKR